MSRGKLWGAVFRELAAIVASVAIVLLISRLGTQFEFSDKKANSVSGYLVAHAVIAATLYALLRCVLSRIWATVTLTVICLVIYYISYLKYSHVREPVIFNDLLNVSSALVFVQYMGTIEIALIVVLTVIVVASVVWLLRQRRKEFSLRIVLVCAVAIVLATQYDSYREKVRESLQWAGFDYHSWAMTKNFRDNGVFVHLLQTSLRNFPPAPTPAERATFVQALTPLHPNRPEQVIFVLCESCWFDDNHFNTTFKPLSRAATASFRSVSPVSGGGTPNSTLEWLAGLPVKHPNVSGILYQEYRDFFSDRTFTLASLYRSLGHKTISAHNFHANMWFRRKVEPLLGFDAFYDVRDLKITDEENYFPRDSHLFEAAKPIVERLGDDPYFLHLATVHMHGPYGDVDGDLGAHEYQVKAARTVADTLSFVEWVRQKSPETVIVVYADHVPALTPFFEKTGADIHDVPVWVFDPDNERAVEFARAADRKRQFCVNGEFTARYIGVSLPQTGYVKSVCLAEPKSPDIEDNHEIPGWVYYMALFDRPGN